MIKVEMRLVMSDECLPVALSLCLDWCRFDTVCCFGTKITHTHTPVPVNGISIGYYVLAQKCRTQLFVYGLKQTDGIFTVLQSQQFEHAVKANCFRWTALEASSVDSITHQATGPCCLWGILYECTLRAWMEKTKKSIKRSKGQTETCCNYVSVQ